MDKTIGILGGGQLGLMIAEYANRLNIRTLILDKAGAPAKQVLAHEQHVDGTFKSPDDVRKLAARCDVLTIEIEHVDTKVLEELASDPNAPDIQPSWRTIRLIQNKFHQKQRLREQGVKVAEFAEVKETTSEAVQQAVSSVGGFPVMLKAATDAYDGRGNYRLRDASDVAKGLDALQGRPLYIEGWADFRMELAVMVVKTHADAAAPEAPEEWKNSTQAYPCVETVHEDSICKLTYCPPRGVSATIQKAAQTLARQAVAAFEGRGIFGVEMFLLQDDILINEIAPRVHNSGHYTLQATPMTQFEAHLHAILKLPIDPTDLEPLRPSIMLNILGGSTPKAHLALAEAAIRESAGKIYLYGKGEGTRGRKMGHIVVTARTMVEAEKRMEPLIRIANQIRGKPLDTSLSPGSRSPRGEQVLVLMGSDSDLPVLEAGLDLLQSFDIRTHVTIASAHRTPWEMAHISASAADNGIKVIIGAAGGAAHLPGMTAAHTRLPVIGIPVKPSIGDGMDSLLSIVQMPRGCPVATVAVNNSANAAQLAIRILALDDSDLARRLQEHLETQTTGVKTKAARMEEIGWKKYLEGMQKK